MDWVPFELFLWAKILKQYGCLCAFVNSPSTNGSNSTRALFVGKATEAVWMPLCFWNFPSNSKALFSTYPVPTDRIPLELFFWAKLLKQYGCLCAFATSLLILRPYFQLTQYRWIEFHSSSFCGQSYWSSMDAIVLLQLRFNGVHTGGTCHTIDLDHKRKKKLIVTKYLPDHKKRALNAKL